MVLKIPPRHIYIKVFSCVVCLEINQGAKKWENGPQNFVTIIRGPEVTKG